MGWRDRRIITVSMIPKKKKKVWTSYMPALCVCVCVCLCVVLVVVYESLCFQLVYMSLDDVLELGIIMRLMVVSEYCS